MSVENVNARMVYLEKQNESLHEEIKRLKKKPGNIIAFIFLNIGFILSLLGVVHSNQASSIIGVAVTFWGGLLLYVKPTQFVRKDILNSSVGVSHFLFYYLKEQGFEGKPRFFSPKTLSNMKNVQYFITKSKEAELPSEEEILHQDLFIKNPPGLLLKPSGIDLLNQIEKELNTNFIFADINIMNKLENAIVENLELASDFEIEIENDNVRIKLTNSLYENYLLDIMDKSSIILLDPLTSALACILAIVTRKSIMTDKYVYEPEKKILSITLKMEDY